MRSVVITKHGGPEVLAVREFPEPEPKAGEVRVRVKAAGLNFAEVMARKGLYPDAPKTPCVVGYEVAGVVDAVGEGVSSPKLGDRVAAMCRFGGHAEAVCVGAHQTFALPDSVSFEIGAALPVNYLTAYHMLFEVWRVKAGDKLLIHMAAGGVGTALLQLLKTVPGVETFGTASAGKHDYVRAIGCDHLIDYRSKDYVEEIKTITGGKGVDVIFDALGGDDWAKGYSILRPGGQLLAFGWANMSSGETRNVFRLASQFFKQPRFNMMGLMDHNRGVAGVNMGHLWDEVDLMRAETLAVVDMLEKGIIAPHVDKVFSFDQAADAHRWLEQGKNVGKVVLVP
jgi:NADPH:quinone reductase-like Zn-dependent oxidoreductase